MAISESSGTLIVARAEYASFPEKREIANAHLIAAAPEMYAALKAIAGTEEDNIGWRGTGHFIDGKWVKPCKDEFACEFCAADASKDSSLIQHAADCIVTKARAALAKAEGVSA